MIVLPPTKHQSAHSMLKLIRVTAVARKVDQILLDV